MPARRPARPRTGRSSTTRKPSARVPAPPSPPRAGGPRGTAVLKAVPAAPRARPLEVPTAATDGERAPRPADTRGKYVYCIIKADEPLRFGPIGIGAEPAEVHTVNYREIAAVVSDTPIGRSIDWKRSSKEL